MLHCLPCYSYNAMICIYSFVFNHDGFPVPADVVIDVDALAITTDIDGEPNDVDVVTIGILIDGCCLVIKSFILHVALPTVLLIQCNDL